MPSCSLCEKIRGGGSFQNVPGPQLRPPALYKQASHPPQSKSLRPRKTFPHAIPSQPLHFRLTLHPSCLRPTLKHRRDRKDLPNLSYFSPISVPSYVACSTGNSHLWNSIFAAVLSNLPWQSFVLTMAQDENAPYEDTSGTVPALRKSATPLTTSKLLNQGSAKVSHNLLIPLRKNV